MIIVSACLAGQPCRYDGNSNEMPWVKALVNKGKAHLVCPEQLGGLPTPRKPCEITNNLRIKSIDGEDYTTHFQDGAQKTLQIAKAIGATKAILKGKSPSCGRGRIYSGNFDKVLVDGNGLTAEILMGEGITVYNEDEAFEFFKPYDALWFDLDDTLMDFKLTQRNAFEGLCLALGFDSPNAWPMLNALYEQFNHPLWKQLEAGLITMDTLRYHRIAQFLQALTDQNLWPQNLTSEQYRLSQNPQMVADYYEGLLGKGDTLLDGALECCQTLSQHYALGLITNGIHRVQTQRLSTSPILPLFKTVVISETTGVSKPDPRIFEHTANQMNLKRPLKVLMIGDSLVSDIAGGNGFNIDTCWYNPHNLLAPADYTPTFSVQHLNQLTAMLSPHPFWGNPEFSRLLTLISSKRTHKKNLLIGIDGYCGSGKTTLGKLLKAIFNAQLVSMDHFYVPDAIKTPERAAIPGHNVHFERFKEEVIDPLSFGRPTEYRPFVCSSQSYGVPISMHAEGIIIVEGSYSANPLIQANYDVSVFLKTTENMQHQRILKRSDEATLQRFIDLWIPYEMTYFDAYAIESSSDLVMMT